MRVDEFLPSSTHIHLHLSDKTAIPLPRGTALTGDRSGTAGEAELFAPHVLISVSQHHSNQKTHILRRVFIVPVLAADVAANCPAASG